MCRFLLYVGAPIIVSDLITEPANSLIHQSFSSQERDEPLNGDGFGLAWYVPQLSPHPGIFRSVSPAWSNRNLYHLARITQTHCILAHVRAASTNSHVTEDNCHPFSTGPYAFMHNGDLAGFQTLRRPLLQRLSDTAFSLIRGTTDSEFLFAYFFDRLTAIRQQSPSLASVEQMAQALEQTIGDVIDLAEKHHMEDKSYLNIAVCDGRAAVVSRYTNDAPEYAESLHVHTGKVYHCVDGVCSLVDAAEKEGAIIISSEKLSEDSGWSTVAVNQLVLTHPSGGVTFRPL